MSNLISIPVASSPFSIPANCQVKSATITAAAATSTLAIADSSGTRLVISVGANGSFQAYLDDADMNGPVTVTVTGAAAIGNIQLE